MKEQHLREKIEDIENLGKYSENGYSFFSTVILKEQVDQCVQISKDYAEQECIMFAEWLLNSQYLYELGMKTKTLTECYQLFKNRENER